MNNTIWMEEKKSDATELYGDITRDIVVVGGGIAGYLAAFQLAESGQSVTLVEAETLFLGVTHHTTAHIEALQSIKYSNLMKSSPTFAELFFNSQQEAIGDYEALVNKYNIDCEFKRVDSCIYAADKANELKEEYLALKSIGADVQYLVDTDILGEKVSAAVNLPNQASFNPIDFLKGLPVNFEIIENTRIIDISFSKKVLYSKFGKIRANKIIIATNFPIINFPGLYFLKMYKSHSYAVAIDNAKDIGGMYQSDKDNGLTFRNYKDCLIVGGFDHRSGRMDEVENFTQLYNDGKRLTNNGQCVYTWSANDCITFDSLPFAGYYTKKPKDIYIISGFNKWGMANALVCAKAISDMINGNKNKYFSMLSPQRKMTGYFAFFKNMLCTVKSLMIKPILPPLRCSSNLSNGEAAIALHNGCKKAVYRDESGNLHICQALCSHLGCQLEFNPDAKSWDCPCHGSRFDINGNIICAPTVKNLKLQK